VAATICVTALAGSQAAPGVTSHHFVIGGTFPLSGAASYYAPTESDSLRAPFAPRC